MKMLRYVLVALAFVVGAWYFVSLMRNTPVPQTTVQPAEQPTAQPAEELAADVYPLYASAVWSPAEATTSPDYGSVLITQSAPVTNVIDIAALSTPFTQYYHDKLTSAGWSVDNSREAGGPGAEVSAYTKGNQFVIVSFHSFFTVTHPDAPSECPCNVQFTLVSGTKIQ